ncbi:MAG: very-short-patch-repair endonuclease [Bacteriophage sp.]|nr:MAG: very-short-patch-repair endonuclease [Bacteriophage sp.]
MASEYLKNEWGLIMDHYSRHKAEIMAAPKHNFGIDPYAWDMGSGMIHMTPIEHAIWCDIRQSGIVMYPQFPACGFFLDFANPLVKVAIECDGKEFHDPVADMARDSVLAASGWTVFRISGRDCKIEGQMDEETHEYQHSPGEKLCNHIARNYKISSRYAGE